MCVIREYKAKIKHIIDLDVLFPTISDETIETYIKFQVIDIHVLLGLINISDDEKKELIEIFEELKDKIK